MRVVSHDVIYGSSQARVISSNRSYPGFWPPLIVTDGSPLDTSRDGTSCQAVQQESPTSTCTSSPCWPSTPAWVTLADPAPHPAQLCQAWSNVNPTNAAVTGPTPSTTRIAVASVVKFWWLIAGIIGLIVAAYWCRLAVDRHSERVEAERRRLAEIVARADRQHAWVVAGG